MSMFFRIFRQNNPKFKIYHKYFQLENNPQQFSENTSLKDINKTIKIYQQEWQQFVQQFDQKLLNNIQTITSQRYDSSTQEIKEKIGDYYYIIKHYYKKDREITQLFEIDQEGNQTLIFDPIKDKIMNKKNIQNFILEKFHFNDNNSILGIMIDVDNTERPLLRIKDINKNKMLKDRIYDCNDFLFSKDSKFLYYIKLNQNQRPYALYRHKLGQIGTLSDDLIFKENDDKYFLESILSKSKDYYFLKLSGQQFFKILISKREYIESDQVPIFININHPGDDLISIEHTKRGFFFLIQNNETQKMLYCQEEDFLQQIQNKNQIQKTQKFEQKFKLQTIYEVQKDCILSEIDFFQDNIIYYIVNKGKSIIVNQNLKTNDIKYLQPKQNEFGLIKPLTNNNSTEKICQFSFESIFSANEIYNLNLQTNNIEIKKSSQIEGKYFDLNNYIMTEQYYYSFDGQKIPIIFVHKKNKKIKNPKFYSKTLVISYGCYGVPTDIEFDISLWNYLENNWILAYPLIRGSTDLGVQWHKQTLKKNKYISIQDLIYCFNYLHSSQISHSSLIAAISNSSGAGLLFSAINNQPHLVKACILQVPFLNFIDLLSQKDLPLTGSDIEEFGDPQNLEDFKNLFQICPYHNIKQNYYPNILLSCYQQDYRTPLWHILNFVNRFRKIAKINKEDEILKNSKNLFVRINKGSHNGVVQYKEKQKEIAEEYLFLEYSLNQFNNDLKNVQHRFKNLNEIFNQLIFNIKFIFEVVFNYYFLNQQL